MSNLIKTKDLGRCSNLRHPGKVYVRVTYRSMAMYMIRHIPTKTYYGLMNDQGKYSLVGFKKEADAKYVADCIASYKYTNEVFPPPDQKVYLMDRHLLKSDAEEEALWVEDHMNNMSFL